MWLRNLDYKLFKLINGLSRQRVWLDYFGIFCAVYLIWLMAAATLAYFFFLPQGLHVSWLKKEYTRFRYLLVLLAGTGAAYALNVLIGFGYGRLRPFASSLQTNQLISASFIHKSFPSSHATLAFALAMSVFWFNKTWGIPLLVCAGLVTWARVYVGVHYPSDAVVGALLGIVVSYLVYRLV
jgi:undecaprenyl-diphosphatase